MTVAENKIQKKLYQVINESLALLKQASIKEQKPITLDMPIPSLLDQCVELCGQHQAETQEPIRMVHHFGLPSKSLLISSLATLANISVLTNIHPNNNSDKESIKSQTVMAKTTGALHNTEVEADEYRIKAFLDDLQQRQQKSNKIGQRLLICDNNCLSQTKDKYSTNLLTFLKRQFTVRSIIVVSDPVDSYPVYCANIKPDIPFFSFEEYCQSLLDFIQANSGLSVIQYETFIESPEKVMQQICDVLGLSFCKDFLVLEEVFRKNQGNKKQKKATDLSILTSSAVYLQICEILGYQNKTSTKTSKEERDNTIYAPNVYSEYQKISRLSIKKDPPPFILLDSKSLPRSGLHYMKNTLARILGENFSFCEWYQEPGCCKRMPCALTGYTNNCQKMGDSGVRLIKSHDFNFHDPIFSTSYSLRRIVLVRDPLFVLTSYFVIEQLLNYKAVLQEKGIYMEKIWFSHETEVLATAYQLMDQFFVTPKEITLNNWLNKKVAYINGFLKKWGLTDNDQSFSYLVNYNEIDSFIQSLLFDIQDFFPDETRIRMNFFVENSGGRFHARTDPFFTASTKVSEYLRNNSKLFIQAAKKVISADQRNILRLKHDHEYPF